MTEVEQAARKKWLRGPWSTGAFTEPPKPRAPPRGEGDQNPTGLGQSTQPGRIIALALKGSELPLPTPPLSPRGTNYSARPRCGASLPAPRIATARRAPSVGAGSESLSLWEFSQPLAGAGPVLNSPCYLANEKYPLLPLKRPGDTSVLSSG